MLSQCLSQCLSVNHYFIRLFIKCSIFIVLFPLSIMHQQNYTKNINVLIIKNNILQSNIQSQTNKSNSNTDRNSYNILQSINNYYRKQDKHIRSTNHNNHNYIPHHQTIKSIYQRRQLMEELNRSQKPLYFVSLEINEFHKIIEHSLGNYYFINISSQESLSKEQKKYHYSNDKHFKPLPQSLYGVFKPNSSWQKIVWKRTTRVHPQFPIFNFASIPYEIEQGLLADRYFLSGIAALAEIPSRIYSLFLPTCENSLYVSVRIMFRGQWRVMYLDDFMPFLDNKVAFSRCRTNQLWLLFLEKAWAKLYGAYSHIQGGYIEQPLHDLTGAPIKTLFFRKSSKQTIHQYLQLAQRQNFCVVASTNIGQESNMNTNGLIVNYAYTFIGIFEVSYNRKQKKQTIIKLRDAFMKTQYKGRWCKQDPVWVSIKKSDKQRIGFEDQNGIFFMQLQQFIFDFHNIVSAQIIQNSSYINKNCKIKQDNSAIFIAQIVKQGLYSFQIDKTPQRLRLTQNNYKYPYLHLDILTVNQNGIKLIADSRSSKNRRSLFKKVSLNVGVYVIYAKYADNVQVLKQKQQYINLGVYSQSPCKLRVAIKQEQQILKQKLIHRSKTQKQVNQHLFQTPSPKQLSQLYLSNKLSNQTVSYHNSNNISTEYHPNSSKIQQKSIRNQAQSAPHSNQQSRVQKYDRDIQVLSSLLDGLNIDKQKTRKNNSMQIQNSIQIQQYDESIVEQELLVSQLDSSAISHLQQQISWKQLQQMNNFDIEQQDEQQQEKYYNFFRNNIEREYSTIYQVSSSRQQSTVYVETENRQYQNFLENQLALQESYYTYINQSKGDLKE